MRVHRLKEAFRLFPAAEYFCVNIGNLVSLGCFLDNTWRLWLHKGNTGTFYAAVLAAFFLEWRDSGLSFPVRPNPIA